MFHWTLVGPPALWSPSFPSHLVSALLHHYEYLPEARPKQQPAFRVTPARRSHRDLFAQASSFGSFLSCWRNKLRAHVTMQVVVCSRWAKLKGSGRQPRSPPPQEHQQRQP